ncbi:MAG: molybdopterin-synthase adenylyltransferase MoeB [Proteobacteria bacterium]|nr:molybdopterin-synthase adenylyltransferase MoeB [Pseudomonadota bacterium]MDA0983945.1 molybdopterin-synthase adenylyltransferase MoeB [Pseudomonadota bacterium]
MNDAQLLRYSRHILLPEIGIEGQERLRAASALVVGAGGLGCPAALYLATSGVGSLTLADPDQVDLTNLQRQILYRTASVGKPKVDEAKAALNAINPEVAVTVLPRRLESGDLLALAAQADVVLDCSDNFATRHALNRACVAARRPLVSGAAIRFDAQVAVFDLRQPDAPCYACLYPEEGDAEELQCSQMGVFAPLAGVVGALQALEAVKLLAAAGGTLNGRLLLMDARIPEWRTVRVNKDPACAVCGAGFPSP